MKTKLIAAAAAAVVLLNVLAQVDETNIVSVIARKAAEFIQKAIGLLFGVTP